MPRVNKCVPFNRGGGKFANGASTAAIAYLFDSAASSAQSSNDPDACWSGSDGFCFATNADHGRFMAEGPTLAMQLPSLPQGVVDFAAGFGDGISFGLTAKVRGLLNVDGVVNATSSEYGGGYFSGFAVTAGTGAGAVSMGFRSRGALRVLNQNRYFRVGYGSHKGRSTFRVGGKTFERMTGRKHIDLGDGGPL